MSLCGDVNNKVRFENNRGGVRLAASVEGALTGEGGDCLPYDQTVDTEVGSVPIGEIVDDKRDVGRVWSFNHVAYKAELRRIENKQKRRGKAILEIELEDGRKIRCSADHPVFVWGKGYVTAKDLRSGDDCETL
jgi:hypothetical protein